MEDPHFLKMLLAISIIFPIAGLVICAPLYWILGPRFLHARIKPSYARSFANWAAKLFHFTERNETKRLELYTNMSLVTWLILLLTIIPFLLLPVKVIGLVSGIGLIIGIVIAPFILLTTARIEASSLREIFSNTFGVIVIVTWFPVFLITALLAD